LVNLTPPTALDRLSQVLDWRKLEIGRRGDSPVERKSHPTP
jgi:hypothetical protein